MKERDLFLCVATLASAVLGFVRGGGSALADGNRSPFVTSGPGVVMMLLCVVLVCAALLSRSLLAPRPVASALSILACVSATLCSPHTALPMITISALSVCCDYVGAPLLIAVTAASCMAGLFIDAADDTLVIASALIGAGAVYILTLLQKKNEARSDADTRGERVEELRERIGSRDRLASSIARISRLEERNRLAARIHDEIGHGMSGSILLLEGADAIMDDDPAAARATLRRVTETLRGSTDTIRAVLREERSAASVVNLARVRAELASFEAGHPGIRTELTTEGDTESMTGQIWTCVADNMTEAMTNTLKHSNATIFKVTVTNSNKLLTVEFADNGEAGQAGGGERRFTDGAREGIGLQNMEERCALAYGRCFFRRGRDGFRVVMTFPLKD
ncbi:MAG: histidine kinase [Clostridiales Family XIII bacterium]|jgi:signal transduction histidine kinase|nr:histidine kinase [Clostridiales Family XIII bacterium]